MVKSRAPTFQGLIAMDGDRRLKFSCGLGAETALQSLMSDEDWVAGMRTRRISTLTLNAKRLVLLWSAIEGGEILLISSPVGDDAVEFIAAVDFAYDIIKHLVSNPFDAMIIVDANEKVAFISTIHEDFLGQRRGEAIGKPVTDIIENTRMHEVIQTGKAQIGELHQVKGGNRVVTRTPIFRDGEVIGAIGRMMFKGPEELEALNKRANALEREVEFYRREAESFRQRDYDLDMIIGESEPIKRLKADIARIAPLDVPVLIAGESGTGKELVAQALHRLSSRRENRLVTVNAAALPAGLVESELFGYASGAFTGAHQKGHSGKFEQADKGTLFLDEIGDMPLEVQSKLLRVLQDGIVERVGDVRPKHVDFRLISASNRDLEQRVSENEFRLDLFYRISPVILHVPPLRARLDDIPLLAAYFMDEFTARHKMEVEPTPGFFEQLKSLPWPGNVRQLKHEVERACIFATDGNVNEIMRITTQPSETANLTKGLGMPNGNHAPDLLPTGQPLKMMLERVENNEIRNAMSRHGGNKKRVAEELGISRSYLYKKLTEMDMD